MLQLAPETERLARRVAARVGRAPDEVIRATLQREATALGIAPPPGRKRMTVEEMLALGDKVTALPLLDRRSPQEIAVELDAL
ncbi:MAG: hypothetical protein LBV49_00035 [Azonexus sp.]|nr:hypothetical protein [Azonexus sp.]